MNGVSVARILGGGGFETHREAVGRLRDVTGLPRQDLFRSREELISNVLAVQEEKIAYANERLAATASASGGAQ